MGVPTLGIGVRGASGSVLNKGRTPQTGGEQIRGGVQQLSTGSGAKQMLPPIHFPPLPLSSTTIQVGVVPSALQPPSHPEENLPHKPKPNHSPYHVTTDSAELFRMRDPFKSVFPNVGTIDIWVQTILCCGICSVHCRMQVK